MFLRSSKQFFFSAILLFTPLLSAAEYAASASAVGSGKDLSEAMGSAIRSIVQKQVKMPAAALKAVLQNEVLPQASSFVTSYKILDGGRSGFVNLSAQVDAEALTAFFAIQPSNFTATPGEPARALVLVKSIKIEALEKEKLQNYFQPLQELAKESLLRRGFEFLPEQNFEEWNSLTEENSPELAKALGVKSGSQLVLSIGVSRQLVENENTHQDEDRIVLNGNLAETIRGRTLARRSSYFLFPKVQRNLLPAEFQRLLVEEAKQLLRDLYVSAGAGFSGTSTEQQSRLVLRVQYPSNGVLLKKFLAAYDGSKESRGLREWRVRRGQYDFLVTPTTSPNALKAKLKQLELTDLELVFPETVESSSEGGQLLLVQIKPKAVVNETEIKQETTEQ